MFLRSVVAVLLLIWIGLGISHGQTNVPPPSHIFVREVDPEFLGLMNVAIIRRDDPTVTLMFDVGSATDGEGEPLTFEWWEVSPEQVLSTSVRFTNDYAAGQHRVFGWIADSQEGVTGQADFEVLTPLEAVRLLVGDLEIEGLRHDVSRARRSLRSAEHAIEREKWNRGLLRLKRFTRQIGRELNTDDEEQTALYQRWSAAARAIQAVIVKPRGNQSTVPGGVFPGARR